MAVNHRLVLLRVLPEEAALVEQAVPAVVVADCISSAVTKGMAVMAVPMAVMVALDMALTDLRMVLDNTLQPESSVKALGRYMLAAVEEPATKIANQVAAVQVAAAQAVLFGMLPLKLAAQEEQTSAEVVAAENLELKAAPAS